MLMKIPDDLSITLLSKEITSYKSVKNLGVAMDCNLTYARTYNSINFVILLHEKLLQSDWLRAVVFQLNLKYLRVKITNLLRVVV